MMTPEDRAKAVQYEEWSVALFRVFAVKFRLRRCGCHLCDARKDDARWLKGR